MDTKQLEYVLAIASAGSLGRAARHIGLTQQALSKSLARLEADIGGKLFERTSHGMAATRLGETFCERARDVIAASGQLTSALAAELDLERGRLVIGLSPIAATGRAGRIVTAFTTQYPNLRIDIESGIDRDFARALSLGQIDFAIATDSQAINDRLLRENIDKEVWGIAGRINHPFLSKAQSLSDLKDAKWLLGRNTELLDEQIETGFAQAGLARPRPGVMTNSVIFALTALRHFDHLTILPQSLCKTHPDIMWRDFSEGLWETPVYVIRRRRAHLNHTARRLIDQLTKKNPA